MMFLSLMLYNHLNQFVPVISIRLKMGYEPDEITKATRIIILKLEQEGNVGIIVDEVREVVTLTVNEIEKLNYDNKDGKVRFTNAVGKHKGELISLLDLNMITLEENA